MDSMEMANLPSDDAILVEIKDILQNSDLMSVTKKHVKAELEKRYVSLVITVIPLTNKFIASDVIFHSRSSSSAPPSSLSSSAVSYISVLQPKHDPSML